MDAVETSETADAGQAVQTVKPGRGIDRLNVTTVNKLLKHAPVGARLWDGLGLFVQKTQTGGSWRLAYRFGIERHPRTFAIGTYPTMGLGKARERRNEVRALIAAGIDPVQHRRTERAAKMAAAANTVEGLADEWLTIQRREWTPDHASKVTALFRRDLLPLLGPLAVADVTPTHVATVIKGILKRGRFETARKARQFLDSLFMHAVASGYRETNPATASKALLKTRRTVKARPALLDIADLRGVLAAVAASDASEQVKMCSTLVAYTSVRLGNALTAKWQDFDLDGETPVWRIARGNMKVRNAARDDFTVYLGPSLVAALRRWHARSGGKAKGLLFPSPSNPGAPLTHRALEKLYSHTLGLHERMSLHGWRAAFSSNAHDAGFPHDAIEMSLDHLHANGDAVALAYDRGSRRDERIRLATWWDGMLSGDSGGPLPAGVLSLDAKRRTTGAA